MKIRLRVDTIEQNDMMIGINHHIRMTVSLSNPDNGVTTTTVTDYAGEIRQYLFDDLLMLTKLLKYDRSELLVSKFVLGTVGSTNVYVKDVRISRMQKLLNIPPSHVDTLNVGFSGYVLELVDDYDNSIPVTIQLKHALTGSYASFSGFYGHIMPYARLDNYLT